MLAFMRVFYVFFSQTPLLPSCPLPTRALGGQIAAVCLTNMDSLYFDQVPTGHLGCIHIMMLRTIHLGVDGLWVPGCRVHVAGMPCLSKYS